MLWIWQLCFASFSRIIVRVLWANAMTSIQNWFRNFGFRLLYNIDNFPQNFLRFFVNFMFNNFNAEVTLLPYCSNSSTFLSRASFTVLTWFCNKVTYDFKTSIFLSFSLSIALTSFIISFFKSETKSNFNELSFSSNFLFSSSSIFLWRYRKIL